MSYEPLDALPYDIQRDWLATLQHGLPTEDIGDSPGGIFELVAARRTEPQSYEGQRITVLVVNEDGLPLPGIKVAFAYSTAGAYILTPNFRWSPPPPPKAFIVPTAGSGQIDQVQGSTVTDGEPGGVTVYLFEPEWSSDVVTGCGMLADHTGLHLTFQLRRNGIISTSEQLALLEESLAAANAEIDALADRVDDLEQAILSK